MFKVFKKFLEDFSLQKPASIKNCYGSVKTKSFQFKTLILYILCKS